MKNRNKCPKTLTGKHLWSEYSGMIIKEVRGSYYHDIYICSVCGMIDDRKKR